MSQTETALATPGATGLTLENAEKADVLALVAIARKSGLIPVAIKSDDAAALIILKARELGVPWTQSFSAFHVINGLCSCSAQLMLAKAYEKLPGFEFEILASDDEKCRARMRRAPDKPWIELAYTYKQAQLAGLTSKQNWKNHPDDMLRNRVASKLCKMVAPDMFMGLYTDDEAEDVQMKHIPHVETTTAQRLQEQLLGKPPADPETPAAEPEAPPEGEVVDAESVPVEDIPATADWETAIDQADSPESIATSLRQIAADERLTKEEKLALKERAVKAAKAKGFKKAPREAGQEG